MTARRSLLELIGYGVVGLPLAALGLPLVVYLPAYYAELPGLGTAAVGAMLFIARVFDVVTDPLIGWASDHTTTPLGRRKPWLLAGMPVLLLGGWFLFNPTQDAGALWLLGWSLLAYLGWTMISLPYTAMAAELSADYDARSRITAFREGFFVLGTLIAIMLPALIQRSGGSEGDGLRALALFLVISLPLAMLVFMRLVSEPHYATKPVMHFRQGLRLMAGNVAFRRLLIAYLMNGAANGLPAALFIFFVMYVLGADQATAGLLLAIYFVSAVAGLPLWLKLGANWSKHRLWCASMLWACAVFIWAPMLGTGDIIWFGLICVLSGLCLGVDQAIPASIQADVIDEDTVGGGDQRAGLYFGLWGMATKLAFALSVGIAFPLLELAGFVLGMDNSPDSLSALAFLYGGLPVLIKLGVVVLMWNFPLDRKRHAEVQRQLLQVD